MTTANGKKQPVRVFLEGDDYDRYLVQVGTHFGYSPARSPSVARLPESVTATPSQLAQRRLTG